MSLFRQKGIFKLIWTIVDYASSLKQRKFIELMILIEKHKPWINRTK
jgi:hypothetical protein